MRNKGSLGVGKWSGIVDCIRIGVRANIRICLGEVLLDEIWEVRVADVLPKAVEGQGVFFS